jgi:hypothetical protein
MNIWHLLRVLLFAGLFFTAIDGAMAQSANVNVADQATSAASAAEKSAVAAAKSAATAASAASGALERMWSPPGGFFQYFIPIVTFFAAMMTILSIRKALLTTNWSLADALSEETQVTYYSKETFTDDGKGNKTTNREVALDKEGKPVLLTELRASTSRVIALMGMMVIVFLFVGFGIFAMYSFGATGTLPDSMDTLIKFLAAGMTLFTPYLVNKFSSLFSGLSGGK